CAPRPSPSPQACGAETCRQCRIPSSSSAACCDECRVPCWPLIDSDLSLREPWQSFPFRESPRPPPEKIPPPSNDQSAHQSFLSFPRIPVPPAGACRPCDVFDFRPRLIIHLSKTVFQFRGSDTHEQIGSLHEVRRNLRVYHRVGRHTRPECDPRGEQSYCNHRPAQQPERGAQQTIEKREPH